MKVLVTGITGSIGGLLAPRLLAAGHEVRALTRREQTDPALAAVPDGAEVYVGDAVTGKGLRQALSGVEVAYYLIHSMEPATAGAFADSERVAATNFAALAANAGVRRIVYLGGLVPPQDESAARPISPHLDSRLAVERILLGTGATSDMDVVALRASIVIAASSRSFRFLVRLVERMPLLVLPAWREHRTAPVDGRDVVACLINAATSEQASGSSLDVAGPDIVSYQELVERIRDQMLIRRPTLGLRVLTATPIASRVAAVLAGEEHALIGPLMQGLTSDLLPREPLATDVLGVKPHLLDSAIERALRDWESQEDLRAR